jgi:hypothetical protein
MSRKTIRLASVRAGSLAVLGLLVWLLWPSGTSGTELYSGTSRYVVHVTIDQTRIGSTGVTIVLTTRAGSVPKPAPEVSVEAVMPLMGFATPPVAAMAAGNGHYTASGVPLMMTGPWELHVFIGSTDDLTLPFTVTG